MIEEKIAGLILAAGRSARMGAFKPLLPFGDRTILETLIGTYRSAGISDILVVLGHRADEVRCVLDKQRIAWTINEQYDRGMFSSIQTGVKQLPPDCTAFFLQPADIPLIQQETLHRLIKMHRQKQASLICYPCYEGLRGHPPLISLKLKESILAFVEPGGMRTLLSRYAANALNVDCQDAGILQDMDTYKNYQEICNRPKAKNFDIDPPKG